MRTIGNYFEEYFHRNSVRKAIKLLKVWELPRNYFYEGEEWQGWQGLLSIFLPPNGYYPRKKVLPYEDFNDYNVVDEFDDDLEERDLDEDDCYNF